MAKRSLTIETQDGMAPATLVHPDADKSVRRAAAHGQPGVILYMDAFGLRPALDHMAQRLADAGYIVLIPDLFYRFGPYGPFDARTAFSVEETRAAIMSLVRGTSQEMTRRDGAAFLRALDSAGASGRIGTVGYCMGGGRAITAAAAYPERIVAAASFHGGNLASDAPDSPHSQAATIRARIYVGSAGVDNGFPPEQSARLAKALRDSQIDHIIENYVGMGHGWAVPDHGAFDPVGAERHWKRLLTFFGETLQEAAL